MRTLTLNNTLKTLKNFNPMNLNLKDFSLKDLDLEDFKKRYFNRTFAVPAAITLVGVGIAAYGIRQIYVGRSGRRGSTAVKGSGKGGLLSLSSLRAPEAAAKDTGKKSFPMEKKHAPLKVNKANHPRTAIANHANSAVEFRRPRHI